MSTHVDKLRFRHVSLLAVLCTWLVCGTVWGQTADEVTPWRQDIEAQRVGAEKAFATEKVSCYQQFAVNGCMARARQKLNAAMAEAKRQEVVVNNAERKRRADAQVYKLEARELPEAQQGAVEQRAQRAADTKANQERALVKLREQALTQSQSAGTAQVRTRDYQQKEAQKAREHREPTLNNPDSAEKLSTFKQKQQEATAHQVDVEKTRQDRSKPLSAPLPPLGSTATPLTSQLAAP